MFIKNIIFLKVTLIIFSIQVFCKTPVFTINGKKLLHTSDATFLSYIVDYNSTVEYISKGFSSTQLAQTLSPSTIRITDAFPNNNSSNIKIQQWNSVNEWFRRSNLNPIYVIESQVTNQSTALLPYLQANNVFWELHYDCGNVNENILLTIRELLNAYPELMNNLKIVQSNLSFCYSDQNQELLYDKLMKELNYSIDVVTYEESFNMNETKTVENFYTKTKIPIWLKLETQNETFNFEETLIWFNKIEKFARNGFAAVFRQNKWDGLVADSPLYWITMIYKSLVGPKILDTRPSKSRDSDLNVYAHCTNKQNKFSLDDSMTIIATNCDNAQHQNFTIRIVPPHLKSIEVLSYIVSSDESTSTFLNGEKLVFESIFNNHTLKPKISTVRVINHMIPLSLSAKSIGFFIVKTKISACTNKTYTSPNENLIKQNGEDSQKYLNFEEIMSHNSKLTKNATTKTLNLEIVYAERPNSKEISSSVKKIELKLTDEEVKQILLNRAKAKANELNITITSEEIENEILREVQNITKMEDERPKRDINMIELRKHTAKTQVNPAMYGKVSKHDFHKKQLYPHIPKGRYADYDDVPVTKKYIEDNVKFLMGPNHSSEKSYSSYDLDEVDNHQRWSSDIDEENVRNAVRLLEDYMENSKNSEETHSHYRNHYKFGRRHKRSSNDDQIKKYKRFMVDQLRIISNLKRNPILKIANFQREKLNVPDIKKSSNKNEAENLLFGEIRNSVSRRFKRTNQDNSKDFKSKRFNKHKRKISVPKVKKGFTNRRARKISGKPRIKKKEKRSTDDLVNSVENQIEDSLFEFKKGIRLERIPTHLTIPTAEQTNSNTNLQNSNNNLTVTVHTMETNNNCNYLKTKNLFDSIPKHINDFFQHIYNEVVNFFT